MTAPPPDPKERPPRRLLVLIAVLATLLLMGCLGSGTLFWYVCVYSGPFVGGATTTKVALPSTSPGP